MGLARYLVEAVVLEGRSVTELARGHGVSRFWIYKLLARYREGGYPALEPRSRRPRSCSHQTAPEVEDEVVRLRAQLIQAGFDAGPQTILYHLQGRVPKLPSADDVGGFDGVVGGGAQVSRYPSRLARYGPKAHDRRHGPDISAARRTLRYALCQARSGTH